MTFIKRYLFSLGAVLTLPSTPALGQDYQADARSRLEASITELASVRAVIADERVPLATELRELETKALNLRRERERMQRLVDNQSVDLSTLENQVKAYDDEATYTLNLLNDYLNRVNASLSIGEVPKLGGAFLDVLNRAGNTDLPVGDRLAIQLEGVKLALDRAVDNVGGNRFSGQAVLPNGQLVTGNFAQIGPVSYFAADAANAGIVLRGSSEQPALVIFDPRSAPLINDFVTSGSGILPIDATLGRALAIATANETLLEHFQKGGLWMYPILFFGVLALVIGVFKLVDILSIKPMPKEAMEKVFALVRQDRLPEAIHYANTLSGPEAEMIQKGLQNYHLPKELLEEFLFETLLTVKPRLERGISFITLAASVAPLLGLLGTVTGMIETFKLLTLFGTGDAKSLSSGISEALITTEFGLVVAIPSLILGAVVSRIVTSKLAGLEKLMITYANGLAASKEAPADVAEPEPVHA